MDESPHQDRTSTNGAPRSTRLTALARHPTLRLGLLWALCQWASLPPLGWARLGWFAPVPAALLVRTPQLVGARPYAALWTAGFVYWAATLHWLRLPHPATSIGWLALAFYLAFYTPLIVAAARALDKRFGVGVVLGLPTAWIAADQARAYVFTGLSMSSLAHSQYRVPEVIQCADLAGEFGVTFLMVVAGSAAARAWPVFGLRGSFRWLIVALAVVGAMYAYGVWRLPREPLRGKSLRGKSLRIALVQGSITSEVKHDPAKPPLIYEHYDRLTRAALDVDPAIRLVVWPETMFPYPWLEVADDASPPAGESWTKAQVRENAEIFRRWVDVSVRTWQRPALLGIPAVEFGRGATRSYNSALFVAADGRPQGRYDKRHRVLFGEYVPLADRIPWLYRLTPLTGGIAAGEKAETFEVDGVRLAPNICYESALARVVRRQVVELADAGRDPDVLVNLTNDSWFRGSSELQLHLACGVFRAVECRKPFVAAANTGISAHIDPYGRIVQEGAPLAAGVLTAEVVVPPALGSPYLRYGDWLANLALIAAAAGIFPLALRRRQAEAGSGSR